MRSKSHGSLKLLRRGQFDGLISLLPFTLLLLLLVLGADAKSQPPNTFAQLCVIHPYTRSSTVAYDPATATYTLVPSDNSYYDDNDDDYYYRDDYQDGNDFGVGMNDSTTTAATGNSSAASISHNINATINEGDRTSESYSSNNQRNNLRHRLLQSGIPSFLVDMDNNNNNNNNRNNESLSYYRVRECPCARGIYCHVDHDTCGIASSVVYNGDDDGTGRNNVGCFRRSSKKTLLRNAWPLLILWYATIFFFLLCTEKGRNARHYIARKVCHSRLNERLVDRFLTVHGFVTNRIPAEQQQQQQTATLTQNWEDIVYGRPGSIGGDPSRQTLQWLPTARPVVPEEERSPTELVLRTRIYHGNTRERDRNHDDHRGRDKDDTSYIDGINDNDRNDNIGEDEKSSHDDNEDYDTCCTICFAPLQEGDRVGILPCDHTFHVDCLREWLPRRNVCPLCQNDRAATPRYANSNSNSNIDGNNTSPNASVQEENNDEHRDLEITGATDGRINEEISQSHNVIGSSILPTAIVEPATPVQASIIELTLLEQSQPSGQ